MAQVHTLYHYKHYAGTPFANIGISSIFSLTNGICNFRTRVRLGTASAMFIFLLLE